MFGPTSTVTYKYRQGVCLGPMIAALIPFCFPAVIFNPPLLSALSLAASAVWVLESGEHGVRAGGREETNCQGYASEDD